MKPRKVSSVRKATQEYVKAQKASNKTYEAMSAAREQFERIVKHPQYRKMIGTCWTYNNRYSDTEEWLKYIRILDFIDGSFIVEAFETTSYGVLEFKVGEQWGPEFNSRGYTLIDLNIYLEARQKAIEKIGV